MIKFDFEEFCSGCGACYNACPVSAIHMKSNKEGFLIPEVDLKKCISCGRCDMVCPHLNTSQGESLQDTDIKAVWLYASEDDNARMRSSSGAACFELEKASLKNNGVISGCVWNDELRAIHIVGDDGETLRRTQGSKYVQSDMGNCYKQIAGYIKEGKSVVFTGTPCQAAAMDHYVMALGKEEHREKLIVVAVICHGVASPLAWESYKKWEAERNGSPLAKVNFRDKSKEGYKKSYCRYEYRSGVVKYVPTYYPSSKYIEATLVYNLAMRNCCTHCDCRGG